MKIHIENFKTLKNSFNQKKFVPRRKKMKKNLKIIYIYIYKQIQIHIDIHKQSISFI